MIDTTREVVARAICTADGLHFDYVGPSTANLYLGLADAAVAALRPAQDAERAFQLGDRVTKISGSKWTGRVVGFYSTTLTPEGYAVESETETGSVQIYPAKALTLAALRPAQDAERCLNADGCALHIAAMAREIESLRVEVNKAAGCTVYEPKESANA